MSRKGRRRIDDFGPVKHHQSMSNESVEHFVERQQFAVELFDDLVDILNSELLFPHFRSVVVT